MATFLSITGANSTTLNPDLQQPMTNEATASFERELRPNLGIRALYVFKNVVNQYATTNTARPRSAYNIPLTRRDPGPDDVLGTADDGKSVTIYDYDAAYRGAAFVVNQLQNTPRDDHFQSAEFTVTKRYSERWSAIASFWAIKDHRWITGPSPLTIIPDTPNADYFPLDETWRWAGNVSGNYRLPYGVQFGVRLQSKIGVQGQRTTIFRATDPDGGTPLRQLQHRDFADGAVSARRQARRSTCWTFAPAKELIGGSNRSVRFDLFNLLNSSAQTNTQFRRADVPVCDRRGAAAHRATRREIQLLKERVRSRPFSGNPSKGLPDPSVG